jgi:hypothetical protein
VNFIKKYFSRLEEPRKEYYKFEDKFIASNLNRINKRKKFNASDYTALLAPYINTHENITYADYVRLTNNGDKNFLLIRHDVDHDNRTAIKMAEWEAERGLKSTYCLLHTAWYYGPLEDGIYRHSDELVECATRLHELGHEINLHNNLVVTALKEGIDPVEVLKAELSFFREELGIPVTGTSTHGDALCRDYNFRNWELFTECCDDRFGGPRTLSHEEGQVKREIELGKYSMFDFALDYEGYDVKRDIYHTDSGGNQRTRQPAKGRRPFGRNDESVGEVIGILTHPIWWDF